MTKRTHGNRKTLRRKAPDAGGDPTLDRTWTSFPPLGDPGEKHAFLLVLSGPQFGEIFPLVGGRPLVLGRREDCDVQLRDDGVSRRHATLELAGAGAVLCDLDSANGSWVEGARVREAQLVDGSRIQLGAHTTLKLLWADELEARFQVKLAEGALRDPLTGLCNRRHLEDRLASELAGCQRHGRPLAILMCDVDHFKNINDRHGHLAGDEALKMVADVLRGAVRKDDVLARYGGEEFVVVARETARDGAEALAERIREAVERGRCAWRGHELGVTVSIGVTVSSPREQLVAGRSERALVEAADHALYLAKQRGRNRVVTILPGSAEAAAGSS